MAALALTSGVGVALPVMLSLGSPTAAALVAGAATCAAVVAGRGLAERQPRADWCVRADGSVWVQWESGGGHSDRVTAVFVSSGLIVLRDGARTLEVWRDATPAPAFRRLSVAIRWYVGREKSVAFG